MKTFLSKSDYIIGLQCPKYLWTKFHEPNRIPKPDEIAQFKFDQGHLVGELAKKLFPDGINIQSEDFPKNLKETQELLKSKKPLFEAGFLSENLFSRADILNPVKDKWDIIEVKSSTQVKEENLHDVSFQKYVYEKAGLKINKCYLMHVNNKYIKKGEIEPKKFFILEDISEKVDEITGIQDRIEQMFEIINSKVCPEIKINHKCSDPYECPICGCWDFLPEHNVFHLYRLGKRAFELLENGILNLEDLPENFILTSHQRIQVECAKTKKPYINKERIKEFMDKLKYPLYFMDFETFSTAIPIYDGTRPYQNIPFQFSLHVVNKKDETPKHYSFIADGKEDPRLKFLKELKEKIGDKGSIIVYNQGFEMGRLRELAESFPEHKKWVWGILDRVVDLLVVFRNFYYYDFRQKGSASIKDVLPALSNKNYEGMEISNGEDASLAFLDLAFAKLSETEKNKIRENLEKYCGLDTEAMVLILGKLKEIVG